MGNCGKVHYGAVFSVQTSNVPYQFLSVSLKTRCHSCWSHVLKFVYRCIWFKGKPLGSPNRIWQWLLLHLAHLRSRCQHRRTMKCIEIYDTFEYYIYIYYIYISCTTWKRLSHYLCNDNTSDHDDNGNNDNSLRSLWYVQTSVAVVAYKLYSL